MLLKFDSKNERESYKISHIEAELSHRGSCFAYQRDTRTLYRVLSAGEGPHKWEQVAGPFRAPAFDESSMRPDKEVVTSDSAVIATDHHIVFDDLTVGQNATYTIDGQLEFRQDDVGVNVPPRETVYQRGPLTLDGQMIVDGELVFIDVVEDDRLGFIRPIIAVGETITVPEFFQLHYPGNVQVDGELVINGELI